MATTIECDELNYHGERDGNILATRLERVLSEYGVRVPRPPTLEAVLAKVQESQVGAGGVTGSLTIAECVACVHTCVRALRACVSGVWLVSWQVGGSIHRDAYQLY